MSDKKDAVWKFRLPDRWETVAAAINEVPDSWRDATGYFAASGDTVIDGKSVLPGVRVEIDQRECKASLRPNFPPYQLAQSALGLRVPSEIILKEPTWNDEPGVPLALARELALYLFQRDFHGSVRFQSPHINTSQGFRFHLETCEFRFGENGERVITVKVDRYWGGETENVRLLVEVLKQLGLELLSEPEQEIVAS